MTVELGDEAYFVHRYQMIDADGRPYRVGYRLATGVVIGIHQDTDLALISVGWLFKSTVKVKLSSVHKSRMSAQWEIGSK